MEQAAGKLRSNGKSISVLKLPSTQIAGTRKQDWSTRLVLYTQAETPLIQTSRLARATRQMETDQQHDLRLTFDASRHVRGKQQLSEEKRFAVLGVQSPTYRQEASQREVVDNTSFASPLMHPETNGTCRSKLASSAMSVSGQFSVSPETCDVSTSASRKSVSRELWAEKCLMFPPFTIRMQNKK